MYNLLELISPVISLCYVSLLSSNKMIKIDDTCLDIYSQACLISFYNNYIIELQLAINTDVSEIIISLIWILWYNFERLFVFKVDL